MVRIPVILALPLTTNAVLDPPTTTLLKVETPTVIPALEEFPSARV